MKIQSLLTLTVLGLTTAVAQAQDAAPAPVEVMNDLNSPVPTYQTNNALVTVTNSSVNVTPIAETNFASFQAFCNPSGGDTWLAQLTGAVPNGKRLVIDSFSVEMSLPSTTFAHLYIRPVQPGQAVDTYARQWIPMQSQGVGFAYGNQSRKVLSANQAVHAVMDPGQNLDVVIQASDILAASQGTCQFAVLGHYIPKAPIIIIGQ